MKIPTHKADSFMRAPDRQCVVLYGPDQGMVAERAMQLVRAIAGDPPDSFRYTELPASSISDDPARLHDELAAQSLMGGRRVVRLRDADDKISKILSSLLADMPQTDTLLVIEAGELESRSKLRALAEEHELAAALACYLPEGPELQKALAEMLRSEHLKIEADALHLLANSLPADRQLLKREVEKLAHYCMGQNEIGIDDVRACLGDSAESGLDDVVWAMGDGLRPDMLSASSRLLREGQSPIALLRTASKHLQKLHWLHAQMQQGQGVAQAVEKMRPPVFFKRKAQLIAQAKRSKLAGLTAALVALNNAEAACKKSNCPDEAMCQMALLQASQLLSTGPSN